MLLSPAKYITSLKFGGIRLFSYIHSSNLFFASFTTSSIPHNIAEAKISDRINLTSHNNIKISVLIDFLINVLVLRRYNTI